MDCWAQRCRKSFANRKRRKVNLPVLKLSFIVAGGVTAAFVVFLGSYAMLGDQTSEPNPYVVFVTCLVGAVFSEDIWTWAREKFMPKKEEEAAKLAKEKEAKEKEAKEKEAKEKEAKEKEAKEKEAKEKEAKEKEAKEKEAKKRPRRKRPRKKGQGERGQGERGQGEDRGGNGCGREPQERRSTATGKAHHSGK